MTEHDFNKPDYDSNDIVNDMIVPVMWPASQSQLHTSFIFIEINFYSLSFLCDVCNKVHEHM